MGVSVIQEQHDIVLGTIRRITKGDWKVLVLDESSQKILHNVVQDDDILNQNIANIERIEERREMNPTMDAIYILSPQSHIVDCLMADFDRGRYRRAFLIWTSLPDTALRRRLDSAPSSKSMIADLETLNIDFFPRESHLVTFRDPWSFPILYHPDCNNLVRDHMQTLAQRITGVCVSLGEYPKVRYYRPANPLHEAGVLSQHLARFVQEELDQYAQWNPNFPPQTSRPQGVLVITDRAMDLMAPLVHEFTYQAMAHDLLEIVDGDKTTYHMTINEGTPEAEDKDMELQEKDKVWVDNRHRHMKDTIDKLMGDFQKFLDQNPHFTNDQDTTSLNAIKDMLAGLPQFQEMKEAYSLHLTMAQECMNAFQNRKLADVASAEQTLATGLDEDYRKPKNLLDQVVRLLDDEAIVPRDRLRLVMLYILFRDGVIVEDVKRLLTHSSLQLKDGEMIANLELLGARVTHGLKETRTAPPPLFPIDTKNRAQNEEYALSRFEPGIKHLLDHLCKGTLDQNTFPYVKPPLDPNEDALAAAQGSLRAAKPSWAGAGRRVVENRQRIVVYMAGGATFSEARACYEASARHSRDVVLATSHMLTPKLFIKQLDDLSLDRRRLDIPMERPRPKAPAHLFERDEPARPQPPPQQQQPQQQSMPGRSSGGGLPSGPMAGGRPSQGRPPPAGGIGGIPSGPRPPTKQMGQMTLSSGRAPAPGPQPLNGRDNYYDSPPSSSGQGDGKLHKADRDKKKRGLFGLKK